MGHVLAALLALLALALLVLLATAVAVGARQRRLERHGAVPMNVRRIPGRRTRGWVSGVGRCEPERLAWYRSLSLSPLPRYSASRLELQMVGRRSPSRTEAIALPPGSVIVECQQAGDRVELAMTERAAAGFLAWLEAVPPASRMPRGSSS